MPRFPAHLLVDPETQTDAPAPDDARGPSKSQRKREMTALQELGEKLIELPNTRLQQLPLPESLLEAIREAQRIKSHEGKRRQLQYVGKLMRRVDAKAIAQQIAIWEAGSQALTDQFHALERWRDRLLEDDQAVTDFVADHPTIDVTHLRNLIRQARREQQRNTTLQPGQTPQRKAYRELFQTLKASVDTPP